MTQRPAKSSTGKTGLDPLLHQPVRTKLVAYLAARGVTSFSDLKQVLDVSDGNLESHLKKLVAAGYLSARKEMPKGKGRPRSLYALSPAGDHAFSAYVKALQALLLPPD